MCAIWLIEPIGGCSPLRAEMTPAMKVDATAPIPGVRTPSLPVAGAICRAVISMTISDRSFDAHIVKQILCILQHMRPLPDLSIRQLEYLVAVAEEPTWAVAAERVGVSASALSQGLAELERRLGVALFDRDGRRRLVRPSAAPVVTHARQVLGLTNDLAGWAERLRTGRSGALRLGMIDAAAVVHCPDQLRTFRAGHPDVDLRLRVSPSAQLVELLVAGQLDLVVCVEPPVPVTGIDTEPLLTEDPRGLRAARSPHRPTLDVGAVGAVPGRFAHSHRRRRRAATARRPDRRGRREPPARGAA